MNGLDIINGNDYTFIAHFELERNEQIFTSLFWKENTLICGGWKRKIYFFDLIKLQRKSTIDTISTISYMFLYEHYIIIGEYNFF
jgi:hypothetical protein